MKKLILLCVFMSVLSVAFAQNNIGINNSNPPASAALMVDTASTGPQGILVPRMTQSRRSSIVAPATGLMIYQIDNTPGFYYYNGTAWSGISSGNATFPNVEVNTSVTSSQTINDLEAANPPTFSILNFSATNSANAILTGGNTWDGNTFTAGANGAGWYQITCQMVGATISGFNTNAATQVNVHMFLDKNNYFGTNVGNNTAPAYVQSTTNNTQYPYAWSNVISAVSSHLWLKGTAQLNTTIYLDADDFINLKACSGSTSFASKTSSDGSSNITITRLK